MNTNIASLCELIHILKTCLFLSAKKIQDEHYLPTFSSVNWFLA
jgi:hypothetical protein